VGNKLRVAVIGCGLITQIRHLPYLKELANIYEVTAICDLSERVLSEVGDAFGVSRRFTEWSDVLDEPVDAVLIATKGDHAPLVESAARAGKHIFVEKPFSFSVAGGTAASAVAEAAGVRVQVGYMKRYDPAYERLQDHLGNFTDVRFVRMTTLEAPNRAYVSNYPLVAATDVDQAVIEELHTRDEQEITRAISSDDPLIRQMYKWVLLGSMVHELNLVRNLIGEPTSVDYASIRQQGVNLVMTFDTVEAVFSWIDLPGISRYGQELAVYSPGRRAALVLPSPYLRNAPTLLVLESGELETAASRRSEEIVSYEDAFKRELVAFHDCVVSDGEPRTSADDALKDVELCQRIVATFLSQR
jgi:predicted dehydrogenase